MTKATLLFTILLIISIFSCSSGKWQNNIKDPFSFLQKFPPEKKLESTVWLNDTIHLIDAYNIHFVGKLALLKNDFPPTDFHYSVFNAESMEYIGGFLRRGKGPGEYVQCAAYNYKRDTIAILDKLKENICFYSAKMINSQVNKPEKCIALKMANPDDNITHITFFRDFIICTGAFLKGAHKIHDFNGDYINDFGSYWQYNGKDTLSNIHLGTLFNYSINYAANPGNKKIAISNTFGLKIIEFTSDINHPFTEIFNVQWSFPPVMEAGYQRDKPFVIRSAEQFVGAGRLTTIGGYIIFPFSDMKVKDSIKKNIEDQFDYLIVMDFKGTPIAKLKLDKPIFITLQKDLNEEYLYAKHTDIETGFPQVIRFSIKDILEKIK